MAEPRRGPRSAPSGPSGGHRGCAQGHREGQEGRAPGAAPPARPWSGSSGVGRRPRRQASRARRAGRRRTAKAGPWDRSRGPGRGRRNAAPADRPAPAPASRRPAGRALRRPGGRGGDRAARLARARRPRIRCATTSAARQPRPGARRDRLRARPRRLARVNSADPGRSPWTASLVPTTGRRPNRALDWTTRSMRNKTFIFLAGPPAAGPGGGAVAAFAYDSSREDLIAEG